MDTNRRHEEYKQLLWCDTTRTGQVEDFVDGQWTDLSQNSLPFKSYLNQKSEWLWTGWIQFYSLNRDIPFFTAMLGSRPRVIWLHFKWTLRFGLKGKVGECEVPTTCLPLPQPNTLSGCLRQHYIPTHQLLVNLWFKNESISCEQQRYIHGSFNIHGKTHAAEKRTQKVTRKIRAYFYDLHCWHIQFKW
jgi:hypothetical protein